MNKREVKKIASWPVKVNNSTTCSIMNQNGMEVGWGAVPEQVLPSDESL